MKTTTAFVLSILIVVLLQSCTTEDPVPEPQLPEGFPDPGNVNDPFELGRVIFYDKMLSADNSVSCASCHKQANAFADNVAFSKGIMGKTSSRNSMPIQNLSISGGFDSASMEHDTVATPLFWDGRETDIFSMVLQPFTDPNEHGLENTAALENKMNSNPYYQDAFNKLYRSQEVDHSLVSDALVAFITNIVAVETRFDRYQETNSGLDDQELQGLELFFDKYDCNACHQIESPSGYLAVNDGFSNIGLDSLPEDKGLQLVTGISTDAGKFKIPSLRNVTLTAPYMHDGRFETLDEVIEHYSTNLSPDPNLDTLLRDEDGNPLVLNITDEEKAAIIAFLGTLTDQQMITDPNFSDPFK